MFIFRTRGVRVFCLLAGIPDQMFTWLVHDTMMPVKKKICGGLWWLRDYVWIYQSLVIFCRLVLNGNTSSIGFGICFLARAHIKMERRWDSDYWPFILLFSFSFCFSLGCIVYCVEKKKNVSLWFCVGWIQKIVLCTTVLTIVMYKKFCMWLLCTTVDLNSRKKNKI